jgi:hypothetical protein
MDAIAVTADNPARIADTSPRANRWRPVGRHPGCLSVGQPGIKVRGGAALDALWVSSFRFADALHERGGHNYLEVIMDRFAIENTKQPTAVRVRLANIAMAGFTQAGTRS